MNVRWTKPALRDLEDIGDFIAGDDNAAAAKTVATILDAAEALTTHPHLGRAGRIGGTRELVVAHTPFVVPYRVVGDDVQILAVFHGARRWPERFE
jgi:addiction module RelE/StbE family toxin